MSNKRIEITIPVLNEEETLKIQVDKVLSFLNKECLQYGDISIVIADNGSNDQTQIIANELESQNQKVRYLRLEQRGVGLALKASWLSSSADIVGYMDLDLATDLKHLHQVFTAILHDKYDFVAGTRLAKKSIVVGRTPLRNFTSKVFNKILNFKFNGNFTDGMCGFKFLRREILDDLINSGADNDGWFFSTELLVIADYKNYKLLDLPVVWTDDPNSKVKILKLAIEYLKAMSVLKNKVENKI
jgi:glycosyltransferase involved in cell wall biosynthesis